MEKSECLLSRMTFILQAEESHRCQAGSNVVRAASETGKSRLQWVWDRDREKRDTERTSQTLTATDRKEMTVRYRGGPQTGWRKTEQAQWERGCIMNTRGAKGCGQCFHRQSKGQGWIKDGLEALCLAELS